jgi:hypothetical protein
MYLQSKRFNKYKKLMTPYKLYDGYSDENFLFPGKSLDMSTYHN